MSGGGGDRAQSVSDEQYERPSFLILAEEVDRHPRHQVDAVLFERLVRTQSFDADGKHARCFKDDDDDSIAKRQTVPSLNEVAHLPFDHVRNLEVCSGQSVDVLDSQAWRADDAPRRQHIDG